MNEIYKGSRWVEIETNRIIIVTNTSKPWWYYEDDPKKTPWYCYIEDFFIWDRFRRIL